MDAEAVFGAERPVVGMVHLPALPGAPGYDDAGGREAVRAAARRDARRLDAGGVDALLIENFGDAPFYPDSVPRHVVAELTALVGTVRAATDRPVGVNVLRNDGPGAVAVAAATATATAGNDDPEAEADGGSTGSTSTGTATSTRPGNWSDVVEQSPTVAEGPGFGAVGAVLALLVGAVLVARRGL